MCGSGLASLQMVDGSTHAYIYSTTVTAGKLPKETLAVSVTSNPSEIKGEKIMLELQVRNVLCIYRLEW